MDEKYLKQVELLLRIAPEISRINEFGLHGGSAINLFHHNMPRLSVDIDLTYIPFRKRKSDLNNISILLSDLAERLRKIIPGISILPNSDDKEQIKLFCYRGTTLVKVEVNTVNRGIINKTEQYPLCDKAQDLFASFVEMNLVPAGQLFGGKIVAALDRQHPRDLFDTMKLLERNRLNEDTMIGFLFCLFSSNRPLNELLQPNFINQEQILNNQFNGMSDEEFTWNMFKNERIRLVKEIRNRLTDEQKEMIFSVSNGTPKWLYGEWERFPGISWKLKNIKILKEKNSKKFLSQLTQLKKILFE